MSVNILFMLVIVLVLIVLFLTEPIPIDFIALSIPVLLVVFNHWTQITVEDALAGFSNSATLTVLSMFILSTAVQKYGFVQLIGQKIEEVSEGREILQYFIIITVVGLIAGLLNNTPVVAIFIPLVINLAHSSQTSPSKILLPLSYASMLGGTLSVMGSSTNLLASGISDDLIQHPFSIFEFTSLGFVVFVAGIVYLMTFGRKLTPARIKPKENLADSYQIAEFLTAVEVAEDSSLIGLSIDHELDKEEYDFSIIDIIRDEKDVQYDPKRRTIQANDRLIIRGQEETIVELTEWYGLTVLGEDRLSQAEIEETESEKELIEIIIPIGSTAIGKSLNELNFPEKYHSVLFSVRRRQDFNYEGVSDLTLRAGDTLLLKGDESSLKSLQEDYNFMVVRKTDISRFDRRKMVASLAILLGAIALTVFDILSIVISSLLGVVIMIASRLLKPHEAYEAVDWSVIFLLSGLIPLGTALEKTGATKFLANQLIKVSSGLPIIFVLGLFYLFTAVFTNILSNNASVILMIPIAVDVATQLNANPFAFVLAVTFAASTAFLTPIGYQTNLMVYGPGAYKFSDYFRVGAPLQILLAIITPIFIQIIWGL